MIRPQNVALYAAGAKSKSKGLTLDGTIKDMEYLGQTIRYQVLLGGKESILIDESNQQGKRYFTAGERVGVKIEPKRIVTITK